MRSVRSRHPRVHATPVQGGAERPYTGPVYRVRVLASSRGGGVHRRYERLVRAADEGEVRAIVRKAQSESDRLGHEVDFEVKDVERVA